MVWLLAVRGTTVGQFERNDVPGRQGRAAFPFEGENMLGVAVLLSPLVISCPSGCDLPLRL